MTRARERGPRPRVTHAQWSARITRIGATVTLTAELTGNEVEGSDEVDLGVARFIIHEYSGKPPQEGGGFHIEEVDTIEVNVEPGQSSVSTTWTVTPEDEVGQHREVPEYRFTVEWAETKAVSKLLKLGEVAMVRWSSVGAAQPIPHGFGDCVARIDEGKPIGIEVLARGLQGFVCDIEVHEDRPGPLGAPIATIESVPIRSGVARARWSVPEERATELSGARLQLVARLRHGVHVYTPRRSRSRLACFITPRRVYFALYYVVSDNAFRRGADTWAQAVRSWPAWNNRCDMIIKRFRKEDDFRAAWDLIHQSMANSGMSMSIVEGRVFSHASRWTNNDGIEFENGTFDRSDIRTAPPLAWAKGEGLLVLHGCNTGLSRGTGWSPAAEFAARQRVRTIGQTGTSYMSGREDQYEEIKPTTPRVYLWAYRRGRNDPLGDGSKMPGVEFPGSPVPMKKKTRSRTTSRPAVHLV
jgi:hypothetical protein